MMPEMNDTEREPIICSIGVFEVSPSRKNTPVFTLVKIMLEIYTISTSHYSHRYKTQS